MPASSHLSVGRVAVPVMACAVAFGVHFGTLSVSAAGIIAGVLVLAGFYLAPERPDIRLVLIGAALTACPGLLCLAGGGSEQALYSAARTVVLLGLVWPAVLPFWGRTPGAFDARLDGVGVGTLVVAIGSLAVLAVARREALTGSFAVVLDENLYLWQASRFFTDFRGLPVDPQLEPLLRIRQMYVEQGFLNGQYPPGWPAVLAVLRAAGLERFAGELVYALSLIGVVALVRALRGSWSTALLAVALTGLCYLHFFLANSYFSHGITGVLALAGAISSVLAARSTGWTAAALWILGGTFVGLVAAVRPLTGVVAVLAVVWWMLWCRVRSLRSWACMVAGALIPAAGLMLYNAATAGHPLRFGYSLAHDGLQRLGFGPRGEVWFDPDGLALQRIVDFQPADAFVQFVEGLGQGVLAFWPGGLLVVLATVFLHRRERVRWTVIAPFLFLPVAYAFYFFPGPRFVSESVPFAMVATALWADSLCRRDHRIGYLLCWSTILLTLFSGLGQFGERTTRMESRRAYFEAIEIERDRVGPLLVFVDQEREAGTGAVEHGLEALYWYNAHADREVVVLRDVQSSRAEAMQLFPDHVPIRLSSGPVHPGRVWAPPEIELLEKGGHEY